MARKRKQEWWESSNIYDFTDKKKTVNNYIKYMMLRTQQMFKYDGLPESIPQKYLEHYLQMNGHCCIAQVDGKLYALEGGFGGEPNPYYVPTLYIVANPALKLSKNYKIDDDCIVMGNDSMYYGLYPAFSKFSTQLMENDISMMMVDINSRIQAIISAGDDTTKKAADDYLKGIIEGRLGAIYENTFLDGIKTQPFGSQSSNTNSITSLIEYHQYILSRFANFVGLQSNYNMKRESINSNEAQLNEDMLYPLIDDMLAMRKEGIEKVNNLFGTDITVDLASSWKDNRVELEKELEAIESDDSIDNNESDSISDDTVNSNKLEEALEEVIEELEQLLPEDKDKEEDEGNETE